MTDNNGVANRKRMLFVRVEEDTPWTEEEMNNIVDSIDAATPEDVGVMLASDEIEYLDTDEVKQYFTELEDKLCE